MNESQITGFKELFSLGRNAFYTSSAMHPLVKYRISKRARPPGLRQRNPGRQIRYTHKHQARGGSHSSTWQGSPSASCIHLLPARMQCLLELLISGLQVTGQPPGHKEARLLGHTHTLVQGKPENVFAPDNLQGGGNILPIIYSNNKPLPQAHFYSPDLIRYFVNRGRGGREKTIVVIRKMISVCFRRRSNHHSFPS